jgi:O-Antigen ligase
MIVLALLAALLFLVAAVAVLQAVPIERLAFLAVGAFILFVTWNGFRVAGGGISNVFVILAFLVVPLYLVQTRRPVPLPPWLLAAAGGFVVAAMVSYIFPPEQWLLSKSLISYRTEYQSFDLGFIVPRSDFFTLVKYEIAILLLPLLIVAVATTKERVERLMDLFVVGAVVNAAVAMVDYMGIPIAPTETVASRASGLTIHPNYLALTCTLAIPLAVWWISRGGRWRLAGLAATLLLLGGTYVSGSRAGAVTAVLGVILTVPALPSLRKRLWLVLPAACLLLIPLLAFTHAGAGLLDQVRLTGDQSGSDNARANLADIATEQFKARPVSGVGLGVIQDAHNIYLQLLAAGGLIAAASFLTYIAGLANSLRRVYRGPMRDPAVAAGLSVLMFLVNGRYDSQLADKYLYVVPAFLIAMAYSVTATSRATEPPARPAVREPLPAGPVPAGATARPSPAGVR